MTIQTTFKRRIGGAMERKGQPGLPADGRSADYSLELR